MTSSLRHFCNRPAEQVAPELIGAYFAVSGVGGLIVEVEAYAPDDAASHSFSGATTRNAAMFGSPATAYVYRSYGLHWCFNIVCEPGSAALVRAVEPRAGLEEMAARRGMTNLRGLCSGPGKLCQALGIGSAHNFLPLDLPPFELHPRQETVEIVTGPRIGITKATESPWRYGLRGSRFVSRRFAG